MVEEWEVKCARVAEEYAREGLTEGMKVAVLIMMLPKDMQEMVYQMGKVGEELRYQEVRDKVVAVAGHKAKVRVPLPREESAGIQEVESWSWGGTEWTADGDWYGGKWMLLAKVLQRRRVIGVEGWDTLRGNAALQQGRWTSGGTKAALGKVMEKEEAKVMKKEKAKVGGRG